MRQVRRSALVPHTPAQMFMLVNDIASYPDFVPWCKSAWVLEAGPTHLTARLDIARGGLHVALTTRNALTPDERIEMVLAEGPFAHFRGDWRFLAIRDAAGAVHGCRVELLVEFQFRNPALGLIANHAFERSWDSLVDAFVRRGRELYGG